MFHCNEMTQIFTWPGTCPDQQSCMNGISQFWGLGFHCRTEFRDTNNCRTAGPYSPC